MSNSNDLGLAAMQDPRALGLAVATIPDPTNLGSSSHTKPMHGSSTKHS